MPLLYLLLFILLVLFSGFFSSAETALLSLNRIRLGLRARRGSHRARLLESTLKNPDEFLSTILIGNNLVNIASASIATLVFSRYIVADEHLTVLLSTAFTTAVVLIFAEVLPKSYAFRYSERLSYTYAYPLRFFKYLFFPLVRVIAWFQRMVFRKPVQVRGFTPGEVKHFLETQTQLFHQSPDNLRMINEIIDIARKDIKSIMTPRVSVRALDENADFEALKRMIIEERVSKVPLYRGNLDQITGIVHARDVLAAVMNGRLTEMPLKNLAREPLFISEYSSLNYVIDRFRERREQMAVILDEYGITIGILTLNDIFTEIFGDMDMPRHHVRRVADGVYRVPGNMPVEELNEYLGLQLPVRKDYTTINGLFTFHCGRMPRPGTLIRLGPVQLQALRMGRRRIEEIRLRVLPGPGC
ncbi:MAG: hemolysin family protein [Acidobacteriota bacterium]|jgi:CBS domain containing-hemolysin-like protein|nr:hemolysin family protein [Acidobacteriota bacterium]